MRQSVEAEHYFQTDAAISESSRKAQKSKNQAGSPIKLPSKLLGVISDPFNENAIYVAEAAGTIKRIGLETGTTSHTLRPSTPPNPFTCLAIHVTSPTTGTLFAGSWDKNVYVWPIKASVPASATSTTTLQGHSDFLKALVVIPFRETPLLVSASADKSLIVWDAISLTKLHVLTGHQRGVQALAIDPLSLPDVLGGPSDDESAIIASGDSNREIRFWHVSAKAAFEISTGDAASETPVSKSASDADIDPLVIHETSLYSLTYSTSGDLWTASADKTSKRLSRAHNYTADTTLAHDDYVKCVALAQDRDLVVTGSRDEDVRVWEGGRGKCLARLRGHWDEVTGLAIVAGGKAVVSVGIDGTVRRWGLGTDEMKKEIEVFEQGKEEEKKENLMTEEEERELADLMGDSD
ncbi:WD40 repeat-like protein [Microthyrium microscopicum]|uniref:WD40 repeat-like protein n=1 Tax=Microthyrium microscopicum TaxID=703497 RepID=A0A6A6ULH0_9PEZI|nr:WD40 repeat-like protein [Microthyrium microscopicum]